MTHDSFSTQFSRDIGVVRDLDLFAFQMEEFVRVTENIVALNEVMVELTKLSPSTV